MHREHEFNDNDRCIHCSCSRSAIISNNWPCNLIEPITVGDTEKRHEIKWDYSNLVTFLKSVPSIKNDVYTSAHMDNNWYVQFRIDIHHAYAWHAIQIIGSIINSMHDCSIFYPTSVEVDLNGGPMNNLDWVIESKTTKLTPEMCYICFHNNMPQPVDDLKQWDWD